MTEQRVYRTFAEDEQLLIERFEALAKKAQKLGVEPPRFEIVKRFVTDYRRLDGTKFPVNAIEYIVTEAPVALAGGWRWAGVIDHGAEGNVIQGARDAQAVLAKYQTAPAYCAHCELTRNRNRTVIVINEAGEDKQVGMQCLTDFLGHQPPRIWELFEQVELPEAGFDENIDGERFAEFQTAKEIIRYAFRVVARFGYIGTRDDNGFERENNTVGWVKAIIKNKTLADDFPITEQALKDAEDAFNWITNYEPKDDEFYLINLKQVALMGFVKPKFVGMLVGLAMAYPRFLKAKEIAEARAKQEAELTAVVEGKQEIVGTVLNRYFQQNDYGGRMVMLVLDDRGFKVWGTEPAKIETKAGYRVKFTAEVTAGREFGFGFFKRPTKPEILEEPKEEVQ